MDTINLDEERDHWYRYWDFSDWTDADTLPQWFTLNGPLLTDPIIKDALDRAIADGKVAVHHRTKTRLYLTKVGG